MYLLTVSEVEVWNKDVGRVMLSLKSAGEDPALPLPALAAHGN